MLDLLSHRRHADGSDTPQQHDGRQKRSWVCLGQKQVTRELANEIADVEG